MAPLGLLGTLIGYAIAFGLRPGRENEYMGMYGTILVLPLLGAVEAWTQPTPVLENMAWGQTSISWPKGNYGRSTFASRRSDRC